LSALAMLAARGILPSLFGLDSPILFDVIAVAFLAYAAALFVAAARTPVSARTMTAFTAADVAWVVGSAIALILFWPQLAPLGRLLIIVVALIVEAFATLQYRAAGAIRRDSPELA
jgi:uncharacterized membrane protein YdbT with pleckstrin-like domain